MKIKSILPNVVLLSFPNKKELTFTMCRVQEFYEAASDKLRGNVFTWAEFLDEFIDSAGHLDYFHKWSGFNVPGEKFIRWAENFNDHSSREKALIDLVFANVNKNEKFYVIAAEEGEADIEDHEIAHAMWYTNEAYRAAMSELNSLLPSDTRNLLTNCFTNLGYATSVHEDELQAFLATSSEFYLTNRFGMPADMFNRDADKYSKVFEKFCK